MHTALPRAVLAAIVFLGCVSPAQQPLPKDWTGIETTAHFAIRFRPGSRAEASVDRVAALVEDDLARILRELGLEDFAHRIDLWLYDDVDELQRVTGVKSAGHSVPLTSHVPHDNDQTRVHELVHVVAEKFPGRGQRGGTEARNLFFAEGLANAVLRFVHGVHVDAVAAFHRRRGDLPDLATIHALPDFYGWLARHPHVDAYDVAGSWMRFLLDRHGAAKVRAYYVGAPIAESFGADLAALERQWHEHLDTVSLRPGTLALLNQRHGRTAAERNAGIAVLDEAILGDPASWQKLADRALDGRPTDGDWSIQDTAPTALTDAIVRARVEPGAGCFGVRLDLGQECQALVLRGQGTFVYTPQGGVAHDAAVQLNGPLRIVLRRQKGRASIWIDEKLVLEADVADVPAPFRVGCVGGPAKFTEVAARALRQ
jgi:hypothetical protein